MAYNIDSLTQQTHFIHLSFFSLSSVLPQLCLTYA